MLTKIREIIQTRRSVLITLFTRYSLYSVAIVESFLLPKLIDNYNYSQFEYYKNFIFLFPNFLLGSYSGYVYFRYVNGVDYYKQLFQIGSAVTLALAIIGSLILQNYYLIIPFIAINIYTLSEQKLKIERRFTPIFAFKPILSILSVSLAAITYFYNPILYRYDWSIFLVFGVGFIIWILVFGLGRQDFPISIKFNKIAILRYVSMVKIILTGILASFLFSLMMFFERYYIKQYYPDFLPTYSLAFNFSQIIVVLLSAVSYITSVELGERVKTINRQKLIESFKLAFYVFLVIFAMFTLFIYFIQPFYPKFEYLKSITFIITYSKGFFFLIGTISHLAVYNDFNTKMFLFLLKISIINIAIIYGLIYLNTDILFLLIVDSVFVIIYSIYILHIVFNKIDYAKIKLQQNAV